MFDTQQDATFLPARSQDDSSPKWHGMRQFSPLVGVKIHAETSFYVVFSALCRAFQTFEINFLEQTISRFEP